MSNREEYLEKFNDLIRRECLDKFGRFDLRNILPAIHSIEDVRSIIEILETKFSEDEIKKTWHLSKEMKPEDVQTWRDRMHEFVHGFYDKLLTVKDNMVVTTEDNPWIKTYIISSEHLTDYHMKYFGYDSFIKKMIEHRPETKEDIIKKLSDKENIAKIDNESIEKGRSLGLVRLIEPTDGDEATIQVFGCNPLDSVKECVYMPWGPYELSHFVSLPSKEMTLEDMDREISEFIEKYNLKSFLD